MALRRVKLSAAVSLRRVLDESSDPDDEVISREEDFQNDEFQCHNDSESVISNEDALERKMKE